MAAVPESVPWLRDARRSALGQVLGGRPRRAPEKASGAAGLGAHLRVLGPVGPSVLRATETGRRIRNRPGLLRVERGG